MLFGLVRRPIEQTPVGVIVARAQKPRQMTMPSPVGRSLLCITYFQHALPSGVFPAMNPLADPSTADSRRRTKAPDRIGWTVVLHLLAYFVHQSVPRYFVFTKESYGGHFWARASWLFPRVVCALVAVVIGPMKFSPRMRCDHLSFHRIAGRVYVVAALLGAAASWGMAARIAGAPAYATGLACLGAAWVTTTLMAFFAFRRKNLIQHRQWMVRTYVVAFAFVTLRLANDATGFTKVLGEDERAKLLAWGCWAIPLLATEVVLQAPAVFKKRPP